MKFATGKLNMVEDWKLKKKKSKYYVRNSNTTSRYLKAS